MTADELKNKEKYGFYELTEIMALLRAPGGCPWDKEQTHESIRKNLIEETYEAIEAIDTGDNALMCEELGDILLQVVFHSRIAQDEGTFDINDVCDGICKKLIIRHPHVFGEIKADTSEQVLVNWEKIKDKTKKVKSESEGLRSVSAALPALMRADKLGKKSRKYGFDFENADEAFVKVYEEADEVREALKNGDKSEIAEELGDLLLATVNTARLAGIDAEQALYNANEKYIGRFEGVEKLCSEQGRKMSELNQKQLDELWELSKHSK